MLRTSRSLVPQGLRLFMRVLEAAGKNNTILSDRAAWGDDCGFPWALATLQALQGER